MDPEKQRRIASLGGKHSHGGGRRRSSRDEDYDYDYNRSNEDEDWGSRDSELGYYEEDDDDDDWRSEMDEDYEESA